MIRQFVPSIRQYKHDVGTLYLNYNGYGNGLHSGFSPVAYGFRFHGNGTSSGPEYSIQSHTVVTFRAP